MKFKMAHIKHRAGGRHNSVEYSITMENDMPDLTSSLKNVLKARYGTALAHVAMSDSGLLSAITGDGDEISRFDLINRYGMSAAILNTTIYIAPGENRCRVYWIPHKMRPGQSASDLKDQSDWVEVGILDSQLRIVNLAEFLRPIEGAIYGQMGGTTITITPDAYMFNHDTRYECREDDILGYEVLQNGRFVGRIDAPLFGSSHSLNNWHIKPAVGSFDPGGGYNPFHKLGYPAALSDSLESALSRMVALDSVWCFANTGLSLLRQGVGSNEDYLDRAMAEKITFESARDRAVKMFETSDMAIDEIDVRLMDRYVANIVAARLPDRFTQKGIDAMRQRGIIITIEQPDQSQSPSM